MFPQTLFLEMFYTPIGVTKKKMVVHTADEPTNSRSMGM